LVYDVFEILTQRGNTMETFFALLIGVFFSETTKNVAKGSANLLQESWKDRLDKQFISLGLDFDDTPAEFQKKLEAKPEILEQVNQTLEANPDIVKELLKIIKEQSANNPNRTIHAKNYIENAGDITIN